jgi:hypothetical protein
MASELSRSVSPSAQATSSNLDSTKVSVLVA